MRKILTLILITVLGLTTVFTITGCNKASGEAKFEKGIFKNEVSKVYTGTDLVLLNESNGATLEGNDNDTVKADKDSKDVENVTKLDTLEDLNIDTLETNDVSVNYLSPLVFDNEVENATMSVELKVNKNVKNDIGEAQLETIKEDKSEQVEGIDDVEITQSSTKVDDIGGLDNYVFRSAGLYTVKVSFDDRETTFDIEVIEGNFLEDLIKNEALPNVMLNKNSRDFLLMLAEIESELPAVVKDYGDDKDSFYKDNENILKQYNMLRQLTGQKAVSVDEMYESAKNSTSEYAGNGLLKTKSNANTSTSNVFYSGSDAYAILNQYRNANGLGNLARDTELEALAYKRANEIISNFSHSSKGGYNTANKGVYGENIASGAFDAAGVTNAWYNSSGHRANMLHSGYSKVGIACVNSGGVSYWVQLFGYTKNSDGSIGNFGDISKLANVTDVKEITSIVEQAKAQGVNVTQTTQKGADGATETWVKATDENGNISVGAVFVYDTPKPGQMCNWTITQGSESYIEDTYAWVHSVSGSITSEEIMKKNMSKYPQYYTVSADGNVITQTDEYGTCTYTKFLRERSYCATEWPEAETWDAGGVSSIGGFGGCIEIYDPNGNLVERRGMMEDDPTYHAFQEAFVKNGYRLPTGTIVQAPHW